MAKNILIIGVPSALNLGDKIIADNLNYVFQTIGDYNLVHFDLNRGHHDVTTFKINPTLKESRSVKRIKVPGNFKRGKTYFKHISMKRNFRKELRKYVSGSDKVILGGGNLLIDTYWSFPLAVKELIEIVKEENKELHVLCVGVRGPWTKFAKNIFLNTIRYATTATVRDLASYNFLVSFDRSLRQKVMLLADPAVFSNETYSNLVRYKNKQKTVSIGIMDPFEMYRHTGVYWERNNAAKWWVSLIKHFGNHQYNVNIFTNGANADNIFVENYIKSKVDESHPHINFISYPRYSHDIIKAITSSQIVIAQRLHACLPALSFLKDTYGVKWDPKVESIFNDLDLNNNVVDFKEGAGDVFTFVNSGPKFTKVKLKRNIQLKKNLLLSHYKRILK